MAYDEYLKNLMDKKTKVKAFLSNRTMLTGIVTNFDDYCVVVDRCMVTREQLISIQPE